LVGRTSQPIGRHLRRDATVQSLGLLDAEFDAAGVNRRPIGRSTLNTTTPAFRARMIPSTFAGPAEPSQP
jgi:hypothetical protein